MRRTYKDVKDECKTVLNTILNTKYNTICLSGLEWGGLSITEIYIYVRLIRSRIDYGSVVYG